MMMARVKSEPDERKDAPTRIAGIFDAPMPLVAAQPDDAPALLPGINCDVMPEHDQISSAGRGDVLTEAEGVDSPAGIVGQRDARLARYKVHKVTAPRASLPRDFSGAEEPLRDLQQPAVFDRTRDRLRDHMATMTRTRGPVRSVCRRRQSDLASRRMMREKIVIIAAGHSGRAGAQKRARECETFQHSDCP